MDTTQSHPSRREFIKEIGLGAAAITATGLKAGGDDKPKRRPNIVWLVADDQRFNTIRALGNNEIFTPALDLIVRDGTSFTRAYNMGAMHGAVCMPSRAMFMSSRTIFHLTDNGYTIPATDILLPEFLQEQGYVTFGAGKWHNSKSSFSRSFQTGKNVFFGGMFSNQRRCNVCDKKTGSPAHPKNEPDRKNHDFTEQHNVEQFSTELFADTAIEFLKTYKGGNPFFLYTAFTSPHDPRTPPKEFADLYDPTKISLPANFLPRHPFDNGEMTIRDEKLAPWPRTPEAVKRHLADYYGMISHLDAQVGRILGALKDAGHADDTLVVYSADHGLAVGQHGLMGKQNLYDHSIHVPLLMQGPGIPKGERRDGFCYLLDIAPSLCELLGLEPPKSMEGRSFAKCLDSPAHKLRQSTFHAYCDFQRSVQDEKFKLIEYSVGGKQTTQLFDMQSDPLEITNLSEDAQRAAELARLRSDLKNWKKDLGDNSHTD